ncbi:hypothetical protein AB0J55_20040 [Amycolatopsis sp. NPDC049688]|uniref:hypothetical protein n=1 Tax=Amycolatopsis sp. NPDC049688 TaxID=3154733 RepID=UPI003433F680
MLIMERSGRRRTLWFAAGAVILLLLAGTVWLLTRGTDPETALPPRDASECGAITMTDRTGHALDEQLLAPVAAVHHAACQGDYEALAEWMDNPFGTRSADAALAELRANDGAPLTILAQTLEATAIADQGGLTYCHPHGAIAVFARGTPDHQGKLTDFTLTADNPMAGACYDAGSR